MLLLNKIKIEGANALNGIIHGIPAITGFLGFVHALERKTKIKMNKTAIIFHEYELHKGTPGRGVIYEGTEPKNRVNEHIVNSAYIDLTISLLIDCDIEKKDITKIKSLVNTMRVAGGTVAEIDDVSIETDESDVIKKLGYCYVLLDKTNNINNFSGADNLDKILAGCNEGYVALATGFKRLGEFAKIDNARDRETPHAFAEQVYSLGKFELLSDLTTFKDAFWKYHTFDNFYVCTAT